MTYEEQKKQNILNKIKPIANLLNITVDYTIGDREYLTCDSQNICCSGDSEEAVFDEFVAYVFLKRYHRHLGAFEKQVKNHLKMYWYDENFNQPYYK